MDVRIMRVISNRPRSCRYCPEPFRHNPFHYAKSLACRWALDPTVWSLTTEKPVQTDLPTVRRHPIAIVFGRKILGTMVGSIDETKTHGILQTLLVSAS